MPALRATPINNVNHDKDLHERNQKSCSFNFQDACIPSTSPHCRRASRTFFNLRQANFYTCFLIQFNPLYKPLSILNFRGSCKKGSAFLRYGLDLIALRLLPGSGFFFIAFGIVSVGLAQCLQFHVHTSLIVTWSMQASGIEHEIFRK